MKMQINIKEEGDRIRLEDSLCAASCLNRDQSYIWDEEVWEGMEEGALFPKGLKGWMCAMNV